MEQILTVLASLGIGTFAGAWLARGWERRKLLYATKLKLYSSFIESYQAVVANPGDEILRQSCVAKQKKMELVAPDHIVRLSRKFYESNIVEGPTIRDELVGQMRKDLGVL